MSGYVIGFRITISDNQSGIDLKKCRYIFWPSKDKIGPTSNTWDEGHLCEGTITSTVEQKEKGKYYIHVLTYDKAGNYTETVLAEPVEWIAKTRILDYTETYTTPTGWSITAGSYTYRGLQNGTFKTKSLINLSNYSSISFSIVTQSDGYVTHAAYIDFIDASGTTVKTLEQVWGHGSTCVNPYIYTGTMNLSEIPKGSYYIQVTSRNIGGIYNGFVSTGTYIDIIP